MRDTSVKCFCWYGIGMAALPATGREMLVLSVSNKSYI